jgi:NADH-quinone oxidoreductase subunit E
MLSPEEKQAIETEFAHYPEKPAVCIEALKVVQQHRGWVSDAAVAEVADFLGMTPAEVDAVATFYNMIYRKPVGRHVIRVCDSVTCWILGADSLVDHLRKRLGIDLGETTADSRFTLLPQACLGACDRAPAMMVDDTLHGELDAEKIDRVLEEYT